MQFRTPVFFPESPPIALDSPLACFGSCFAERIGTKLQQCLAPAWVNPFGIHYNPVSLAALFDREATEPDWFLHQGRWRSLNHHSQISGSNPARAEEAYLAGHRESVQALERSRTVLLTLGTAQCFVLNGTGRIVANCHRLPQGLFERRRLSVEETLRALHGALSGWLDQGEGRRVIVTVSPVRYRRDGLVENNRGKAVLLLACAELCRQDPRIEYFPAYEIVIDELRDYRFFSPDMVQPSEQAVTYVWEQFCAHYFDARTQETLRLLEKLNQLKQHRPTGQTDHKALARRALALLDQIESSHPGLRTAQTRSFWSEIYS